MFRVFAVLLIFASNYSDAMSTKICKVPNSDAGTCMLLSSCKPLMEIQKKRPKTEQEERFFRQSVASCGGGGVKVKVCCPPQSQWSKLTVMPVDFPDPPIIPETDVNQLGTAPAGVIDDRLGAQLNPLTRPSDNNTATFAAWLADREKMGQSKETCGVDVSNAHRIVGGNATEIDEYPWLALLEYGEDDFRCGGSLISNIHVLTAAHCLVIKPTFVRLAEYNITSYPKDVVEVNGGGNESVTVKQVSVAWTRMHPGYKRATLVDDIGIIKLTESVMFTDFIKPICLPTSDARLAFRAGTNFTVAGWGSDETHAISEVKRSVTVPYVGLADCAEIYEHATERHICAGGVKGQDSCRGDSGGPLMYEDLDASRFVLMGVVSYGPTSCGAEGHPALHTYVYNYVSWIAKMMDAP